MDLASPVARAQPGERHRVGGLHYLGEQASRPVDRPGAVLVAHPGISFGVCTVSSRVRLLGRASAVTYVPLYGT